MDIRQSASDRDESADRMVPERGLSLYWKRAAEQYLEATCGLRAGGLALERRLAAMQASSVWRLDTHDCLLAERGNIGPKLVSGNVFICRAH